MVVHGSVLPLLLICLFDILVYRNYNSGVVKSGSRESVLVLIRGKRTLNYIKVISWFNIVILL